MAQTRKEKLEAMLRDDPTDAEMRYMLAMECASQGDDASAVQHFFEIFALAPNYPPAYHQAGRALQRLNRLTEARAVLERGIAVAQARHDDHTAREMRELLMDLAN